MNLGIYKPGQGHWVRVMTAVLIGLITFALAAWLYGQAKVFADRVLPKAGYLIGLETQDAASFAVGDRVEFATRADATGKFTPIGTATVSSLDPNDKRLVTVKDFQLTPEAITTKQPASSAGTVKKAGVADAKLININTRGGVVGIDQVHPDLLAGGVAGLVLLLGVILGYWLVALRIRTVEFLIATDFEMKKVNWSSPREVMGHTWVVIGACVLLAGVLFAVDIGLQKGFALIGLLPN